MVNFRPTTDRHLSTNTRIMLSSLLTAIVFVFILCLLFEPQWETNDDVGMSMAAHGYGLAAIGTPNLIFSNVLWGYLVRAIPEVNGMLGYSTATLGVLIVVGAVIINGLYRLGLGHIACLSSLTLLLLRPVLFPQFTLNAGLLLIAAVICWCLYEQRNDRRVLWVGCLLAFFSYLVRYQEFFLIFIVALPLISWRNLLSRQSAQTAFFFLVLIIALSVLIDYLAYQGDVWQGFSKFNNARAPFTDFGAGEFLKLRPDILNRYGYRVVGVDLISSWFFADPKICDANTLQAMLADLGLLPDKPASLTNGWIGLQALWHPKLFIFFVVAIAMVLLQPSWKVVASWALCLAAVFAMGVIGRPGVLRVYVPLLGLLVIAPLLVRKLTDWRKPLCAVVLLAACTFNASLVFSESRAAQITAEDARKALVDFPDEAVVVWGAAFPFESVYPVLGASTTAMHYRFYGLGVFTYAPFSTAFAEIQAGRGLVERLMSEKGVFMVAYEHSLALLDTYCREYYNGRIRVLTAYQYGTIVVSRRQCAVKP